MDAASTPPQNDPETLELLERFKELPKLLQGKEVEITFSTERFDAAYPACCEALGLDIGATIRDYVKLSGNLSVYVYASDELAERLVGLPKGTPVRARGVTVFGICHEIEWGPDGPTNKREGVDGIKVLEIK